MKRFVAAGVLFVALISITRSAEACQVLVEYYVSTYSDTTGEFIGGHWQMGWEDVACDGGDGGGSYDTGSGGLPDTPLYSQNLKDLKNLYQSVCGDNVDYSRFASQSDYDYTGMPFPWESYKQSGYDYVLLDQKLVDGTKSIADCMVGQEKSLPPIAQPWGSGTGFRYPGSNAQTPCGAHVYGLGLDLTIQSWTGTGFSPPYDCTIWNALAACAHDAGAWVEPWSMIIANGAPHFHYAFNNPPNDASDYGVCK